MTDERQSDKDERAEALVIAERWKDDPPSSLPPARALGILARAFLAADEDRRVAQGQAMMMESAARTLADKLDTPLPELGALDATLEEAIKRAAEWAYRGAPKDECESTIRDVVKLARSERGDSPTVPRDELIQRKEDMSPRGRLTLLVQSDGDVIVCSQGMRDDLVQPGTSVEFCASGGRSHHTLRALHALAAAMVKDNAEHPIPGER